MIVHVVYKGLQNSDNREVSRRFVSNDPEVNVIKIPKDLLQNNHQHVLEITVTNQYYKQFLDGMKVDAYNSMEQMVVEISSEVQQLAENTPVLEPAVPKGVFRYYTLKKKVTTEAFVNLKIVTGEADLYVKEGTSTLPDLNTWDIKSNTLKNDELTIPVSRPKNSTDTYQTFTVGVYSKSASRYYLEYSTKSKFHYVQMEPGVVLTRYVSKDHPLVLVYTQKQLQKFTVAMSTEIETVRMYYKSFDESAVADFESMMPKTDVQPFLQTKLAGYPSKITVNPGFSQANKRMQVFRIVPESFALVTVYVTPENLPVQLKVNEVFPDRLSNNECQTYAYHYDNEMLEEDLEIVLEQGHLKVFGSEKGFDSSSSHQGLRMAATIKTEGAPVTRTFRISSLLQGSAAESGAMLFREYFVRLCSAATDTRFTISSSKSSNSYSKLLANQRIRIKHGDEKKQHGYYYRTSVEDVKKIRVKVTIGKELMREEDFFRTIGFYWITNDEFGYVKMDGSDKNKWQHAEVERKVSYEDTDGKILELQFMVRTGYFVILPLDTTTFANSLLLQLIINDVIVMSPMGRTYLYARPSFEYKLALFQAKGTTSKLSFSSCGGKSSIEVFDQAANLRVNHVNVDADLAMWGVLGQNHAIVKSESVMLKINNTRSDNEDSKIVIRVDQATEANPLSIDHYFEYYTSPLGNQRYLKVNVEDRRFTLTMEPIQPAVGFENQFKDFKSVNIDYVVVVTNKIPAKYAVPNDCLIEHDDFQKGYTERLHGVKLVARENGLIQWPEEPIRISDIAIPLELAPPYTVMVQTQVKFFGEFNDGNEDDAMLVFRHSASLSESMLFKPANIIRALVGVAIVLCVLVIIVFVKICTQKPPPGYVKQPQRQAELPRLSLEQTPEEAHDASHDSNKLETTEMRESQADTSHQRDTSTETV